MDVWKRCSEDAASALNKFASNPKLLEKCQQLSDLLIQTFRQNGNVFICGNGGSHCDAMHFAEELTGRYRKSRRPLGALALGDASHVTCVGNDYGFDQVFSRQLEALARKGDLLIGLSTSGKSKNVLLAVESAQKIGLKTVSLLGRDGGQLAGKCDLDIIVPGDTSDRIQELHMFILHTAIEVVERALFPENY